MAILTVFLFILGVIEIRYSPRLETTRNRDLLLMYTTIKNKRTYLNLGKI
jgi:hypothetical protein